MKDKLISQSYGGIMQISAISETSSSSTQWSKAQAPSKATASSSTAGTLQSEAPATARSSSPAKATTSPTPTQDLVVSAELGTIAASYSTTVAGKSYSGSVAEAGGIYTASVPMPPGVSASGSSIESAEMNLNMVLDTLA